MRKANGDPILFDASTQVPDGFIYRQNFVSEAEEQKLIREIQKIQLEPFRYYQFTGKRRTASFGWQYEFGASEITAAPEMPPFLLPLRTRAGKVFNIDPASLIQTSSSNILLVRQLDGIGIFRILALWWGSPLARHAG